MLIPLSNLLAVGLLALNPFDIQFPIPELGNCNSMEECKAYCDDSANQDACMNWAQGQGVQTHKPRPEEVKAGPGGCDSRESCDAFCQQPVNMNVCLDFAVQDGFMTQAEADKIKRFQVRHQQRRQRRQEQHREPPRPEEPDINEEKASRAIEKFGGPGGCSNMDECDNFCSTMGNEEICMNYAMEHGLFKPEEAERMKKMMTMEGPGGCIGRECEFYCETPEHQLECMEFAYQEGFMEEEEYQEAKKFMEATGGTGIGPGGCQGQECEAYCDDPAHQDECFEFFKNAGMIDPEEIEMIEMMKQREMEMDMKMREEEMMHFQEDKNRIWEEIEEARQHEGDESLERFYQEFPIGGEWTEEMEQQKDQYWQQVEEQRRIEEERFHQEQMEFEMHMMEKEMMEMMEFQEFEGLEQPLEIEMKGMPELSPAGILLYPFINLLN